LSGLSTVEAVRELLQRRALQLLGCLDGATQDARGEAAADSET